MFIVTLCSWLFDYSVTSNNKNNKVKQKKKMTCTHKIILQDKWIVITHYTFFFFFFVFWNFTNNKRDLYYCVLLAIFISVWFCYTYIWLFSGLFFFSLFLFPLLFFNCHFFPISVRIYWRSLTVAPNK